MLKTVEVIWEDSFFGIGEWLALEELKKLPTAQCRSCGYLLYKDREKVILVLNAGNGTASQPIAIPRGCIKQIKELT